MVYHRLGLGLFNWGQVMFGSSILFQFIIIHYTFSCSSGLGYVGFRYFILVYYYSLYIVSQRRLGYVRSRCFLNSLLFTVPCRLAQVRLCQVKVFFKIFIIHCTLSRTSGQVMLGQGIFFSSLLFTVHYRVAQFRLCYVNVFLVHYYSLCIIAYLRLGYAMSRYFFSFLLFTVYCRVAQVRLCQVKVFFQCEYATFKIYFDTKKYL